MSSASGPWTLKGPSPLPPAQDPIDHGVFDHLLGDLLVAGEVKRFVQGDDGEDVTMRSVAQGRRRADVWSAPQVGDILPARIGHMGLDVFLLVRYILVAGGGGCAGDVPEETMVDDEVGNGQVEVLADQDILLGNSLGRTRPVQVGKHSVGVLIQASVVREQRAAGHAAVKRLESHVGLGELHEGRRVDEAPGVMAADGIEDTTEGELETAENVHHLGGSSC